jgi:hypothetical protein
MDPNNQQPAQQPGWGAPPPPPQQPGWGAPPAPGQPAWGAPPAPGQPAWGAPPPAAKPSFIKRFGPALIGVVVVAVIAIVAGSLLGGGGSGKVFYSKTTYDTNKKTCTFDNAITTATSSDDVYMLADLKDTVPASAKATMEIFKDGVSQGVEEISEGVEYNCYYIKTSIGPLDPGVWKVTITYNGKVEAEGSITITK